MTSAAERPAAIPEAREVGPSSSLIGSGWSTAGEHGSRSRSNGGPGTRDSLRDDALDNLERWRIALSRSDTVRVAVLVQQAHAIREAMHLMDSRSTPAGS